MPTPQITAPGVKRALFLCEASRSVGLGHLSRSLNLADALRLHEYESIFLAPSLDPPYRSWVSKRGHALIERDEPAQDVVAVLGAEDPEWIVVDTYGADSEMIAALAGIARVAVIDDLADRELQAASMIVNPTAGSEPWTYRTGGTTELLLGATYALVHDVFRRRRAVSLQKREFPADVRHVGVALGGTDSSSLAPAVLECLAGWSGVEVRVAGSAAGYTNPGNVRSLGFLDAPSLADLMDWSDLFIATPSTLTWELATLGVPAVFVQTVENQRFIAQYLRDEAGVQVAHTRDQVSTLLEQPRWSASRRIKMSEVLSQICDGAGAVRVAACLAK